MSSMSDYETNLRQLRENGYEQGRLEAARKCHRLALDALITARFWRIEGNLAMAREWKIKGDAFGEAGDEIRGEIEP